MRGIALVALVVLSFSLTAAERPNIIFFLFDDMGYGQPGCYSKTTKFKTPNLDKLATQGMRFTDAHSPSAVCTPTRYGVLTGRYPSRIGQYGVLTTYSPPLIPKDRLTVAGLMKQQGYKTACIGKWHLGMNWAEKPSKKDAPAPIGALTTDGPIAIGFDVFWGFTHARNIGMIIEQDKVTQNLNEVEVQPAQIKRVVEYIDEQAKGKEPFFLYIPVCPPHTPVVPADEFKGKSGVDEYGDWIYQGDDMLGKVMAALEANKLTDNTLLIVSSDNGAEHRAYEPLRESKRSIYEGGHRVPYVARWPGHIKAGTTCDTPTVLTDLMATCADVVGVKIPEGAAEDSISILPELLGNASKPSRDSVINQSMAADLAIRQGPWKLVFLKNGRQELYDLESDISEKTNLITAKPELVAEMTARMQKAIDNGRTSEGSPQKNDAKINIDGSGNKKNK